MRKSDGTEDQFIGTQLPGTGGDVRQRDGLDGAKQRDDVEGHIRNLSKAIDDEAGPDGARNKALFTGEDDDVEGHRAMRESDPDGLYRGGPTTQGEVIRRGPGDNPHGER